MAFCPEALVLAASILSKSAWSATRVTETTCTPPPGAVTTFAVLREACGSPARATLRETTAVWSDVTDSPDTATSSPTESDIRQSYRGPAPRGTFTASG